MTVLENKIQNCTIESDVKIVNPCNLYGCKIGKNTFIGPFVEIQKDVSIGENVRISSHSFICTNVTIEDDVFVAHGVMFTNDKFDSDNIKNWISRKTHVGKGTRIGSNATILPVKIGKNCIIGAGSVVTKDISDNSVVYGNPAKIK